MRTAIALTAVLFAVTFTARPLPAQVKSAQQKPATKKTAPRGGPFPGLIEALQKSPGCLGVERAITVSRKNVIFAWFKDKKSAVAWYNSEYHRKVMAKSFPKVAGGEPLKDVADDVGPIMAIASITLSGKAQVEGTKLPISQIAIELYTPLKGGLSYGGTFAPKGVKAKGVK